MFDFTVIREDSTTAPFQFRVEETTSSEEAEIENTDQEGGGGLDDLIEILGTSESKTDVESKLLSMITNDPGEAANALSSLFEHDNQGDSLNTKKELMDLMVRDPVAVTAVSCNQNPRKSNLCTVLARFRGKARFRGQRPPDNASVFTVGGNSI